MSTGRRHHSTQRALVWLLTAPAAIAACDGAGRGPAQQPGTASDAGGPGVTITQGELEIVEPLIPQPPVGHDTSLYLTVHNRGTESDTLVGIDAVGAAQASIHRSTVENGVARMAEAGAQSIAAGDSLVLGPGGLHGMLIGFGRKPEVGDTIALTLHFRHGGDIHLSVPVITYAELADRAR